MKLFCLAVSAAIWSVYAYPKGPEAPKQLILNLKLYAQNEITS